MFLLHEEPKYIYTLHINNVFLTLIETTYCFNSVFEKSMKPVAMDRVVMSF